MAGQGSFGTVFVDQMALARWAHDVWEAPKLVPLEPLPLHPAAHVLHYGSACFEGLKAHRGVDGVVRAFRLEAHIRRLQDSARAVVLPPPPAELISEMVTEVVRAGLDVVPDPPGALYIRPTLIGTEANIGAASQPAAEATLFVVASPVGDYFPGGLRPLSVAVETEWPRTTPQFGAVKTGANYAMALGISIQAARQLGVDQVLFAPGGQIQEAGASNFLLLDDHHVVTPQRTGAFLNGITLDSVLAIAADLGYEVDERPLSIDEVLAWAARPGSEAALSGTAAVLAGVGQLVHPNGCTTLGSGKVGHNTQRLRRALTETQRAQHPDRHHWLTPILR